MKNYIDAVANPDHASAILSLRPGRYFGVRSLRAPSPPDNPEIDLACSVRKVSSTTIHAFVENGGYEIEFDRRTGNSTIMHGPRGPQNVEGWGRICVVAPSHFPHRGYQDLIDKLRTHMKEGIVSTTLDAIEAQLDGLSEEPVGDIETCIDAAMRHGADTDKDYEVGDLQDLLRAAVAVMSPEQKKAFFEGKVVRRVIADAAMTDEARSKDKPSRDIWDEEQVPY